MADTEWYGYEDQDFDNAANYSNGVPGDGDNLVVRQTAINGINGADKSSIELALLEVEDGFPYHIGTPSLPLQIDSDKLVYQGNGGAVLSGGYGDATLAARDNSRDGITLDIGTTSSMNIRCVRGGCTITNGPSSGTINSLSMASSDGEMLLDGNIVKIGPTTNLHCSAGTLISNYRGFTRTSIIGGRYICQTSTVTSFLYVAAGGYVLYDSTSRVSFLYLFSGTLDARSSKVVGPISGYVFNGGVLDLRGNEILTGTIHNVAGKILTSGSHSLTIVNH